MENFLLPCMAVCDVYIYILCRTFICRRVEGILYSLDLNGPFGDFKNSRHGYAKFGNSPQ